MTRTASPRAKNVTTALLRRMPLPSPDSSSDKDARGRVMIVGGSMEVAGAILLSGVAALRAGAGKLQMATVRGAAVQLAMAVPEALVVGLPATRDGGIAGAASVALLREPASRVHALLIGPGMMQNRSVHALVAGLVRGMGDESTLVLDAAGMFALTSDEQMLMGLQGRAVLTPHSGEMATLLGISKDEVEVDPAAIAMRAAARFGAVVALKGAESWIATPDGELFHYTGGVVGLATSGSGDTLAGIAVGLAARGATALEAALWSVWAHGTAGQRLSKRIAPVGFLARELLAELPALVGRAR